MDNGSRCATAEIDRRRIRLDLAYDGTDFAGWAKQPGLRTVQGTLEAGLAKVLRSVAYGIDELPVTVAGRTDAGVHARGQVVHFDVPVAAWQALPGRSDRTPEQALLDRLAGVLPSDIAATRAMIAPTGFDARFSALSRTYEYRIADRVSLWDPLLRNHVLHYRRTLDAEAMHAAMQPLLGLRDFAAFCRPREGATTIRDLLEFDWRRGENGLVVGTITADAFCHNLVRALVGAAIAVGEGRKPVYWPREVLEAGRRELAAAVVPPHGLTLEYVSYPPDHELAERAERIRAKRSVSTGT